MSSLLHRSASWGAVSLFASSSSSTITTSTVNHRDGDPCVTFILKPLSPVRQSVRSTLSTKLVRLVLTGSLSILQLKAPVIMLPAVHLITLSFSTAQVPVTFKEAIVVPIHKRKGMPACSPSSCHPVAIPPALSKCYRGWCCPSFHPFMKRGSLHASSGFERTTAPPWLRRMHMEHGPELCW